MIRECIVCNLKVRVLKNTVQDGLCWRCRQSKEKRKTYNTNIEANRKKQRDRYKERKLERGRLCSECPKAIGHAGKTGMCHRCSKNRHNPDYRKRRYV